MAISYTQAMRADAKAAGTGLVTVGIEDTDGMKIKAQFLAGPLQRRFAKWALAWLASEEVHRLPDLEARFLSAMEETP